MQRTVYFFRWMRWCALLGGMALSSCVDRIDFDTPDELGRIVVSGRITTTPGPQSIHLGQISGFSGGTLVPIPDAEVTLWEDSTNAFPYRYDSADIYTLAAPNFSGQPGQSYHLEITLPDGRQILSHPEKMPPRPELTRIRYRIAAKEILTPDEILVTRDLVEVLVNTRIEEMPQGPYLRWHGEEIFIFQEVYYPWNPLYQPSTCYIYDYPDGQRMQLFNGDELEVDSYEDLVVFDRPFDSTFSWKHYFNVYVSALTPEAMDYWELVDANVNLVGNIFDAPPAPLPGNMYRPDDPQAFVLGYFEANSEDTIRTFTVPGDFWPGRRVPRACRPLEFDNGRPIYAGHCFDCLQLKGATLVRPGWF